MKGLLPLWSANKNLHQTVHSGDKGLLAWWFFCTSSLHISDIWPASGKAWFLPQEICLSPSTEIWKEEALTTPVGVSLCRRAHLMSQQAWEVHIHMCRSQMRERSAHMPDLLNLSYGRPRALLVSIITISQHLDHRGPLEALSKPLPSESSGPTLLPPQAQMTAPQIKKGAVTLPPGALGNSSHCTDPRLHMWVCSWAVYHWLCSRNVIKPNQHNFFEKESFLLCLGTRIGYDFNDLFCTVMDLKFFFP